MNSIDNLKLPQSKVCYTDLDILDGTGRCIENGYLCLDSNLITYVGSEIPAEFKSKPELLVSAKGYLATPGFINAHTHAAMGFFRDLGHGHSNMIENFLFPAEKSLTPDMLEPLSWSFLYGSLLSGVTCIADHYYFVEGIGNALEKLGMRGIIGETVADLGGAFPGDQSEQRAKKFLDQWNYSDRITPAIAPHAADTVSKPLLTRLAELSKSENLPLHMHLSQTKGERERVEKQHGCSPVKYAEDCGALGPNTLAVHLVSATGDDFNILKQTGTTAGYCPSSQIIYEGLAPIQEFHKHKIPVALGTDCPASNDGADMMSEGKISGILNLHTRSTNSELSSDPFLVIKSMTTNSAKVFGLGDSIGTLEAGKKADIVFLKQDLDCSPVADFHTNLIYSKNSSHVRHVMIDGEFALKNRQPVKMSISDMTEAYEQSVETIKALALS